MLSKKLNRGFTLIELLVVITIIGILAVGGFNIYTSQIQKARDSSRLKGLDALKLAVEQVYQDSSEYPHTDSFGTGTTTGITGVHTYMERIPTDAKNGQTCYGRSTCSYIYGVSVDSNGIEFGEYEISIAFENEGNIKSKAEKDAGSDDLRYESGINVGSDIVHITEASGSNSNITTPACRMLSAGIDSGPVIFDSTGNSANNDTSIFLSDDC